jgi:hypothetical protein
MQMATDSSFARRGMIEQLKKEKVFHSVTDATDSSSTRVATTVAQLAAMTLTDDDDSPSDSATWDKILKSRSSTPSLPPKSRTPPPVPPPHLLADFDFDSFLESTPSPSPKSQTLPGLPPGSPPAYDKDNREPILSNTQKLRLKELLGGRWAEKTMKRGDELASLLFRDPIPAGMLVDLKKLTSGSFVLMFPRHDPNHGSPTEHMSSRAVSYFTWVHQV